MNEYYLASSSHLARPKLNFFSGMTDLCAEDMGKSVWEFGIRSKGNEADKSGFFFFSLRTEMARVQTVVHSVHRYKADQLTHLAATYNGSMMCFYVNGARVGMSKSQVYLRVSRGVFFIVLIKLSLIDGTDLLRPQKWLSSCISWGSCGEPTRIGLGSFSRLGSSDQNLENQSKPPGDR